MQEKLISGDENGSRDGVSSVKMSFNKDDEDRGHAMSVVGSSLNESNRKLSMNNDPQSMRSMTIEPPDVMRQRRGTANT